MPRLAGESDREPEEDESEDRVERGDERYEARTSGRLVWRT